MSTLYILRIFFFVGFSFFSNVAGIKSIIYAHKSEYYYVFLIVGIILLFSSFVILVYTMKKHEKRHTLDKF